MPVIDLDSEYDSRLEAMAPAYLKGRKKAALRVRWLIDTARTALAGSDSPLPDPSPVRPAGNSTENIDPPSVEATEDTVPTSFRAAVDQHKPSAGRSAKRGRRARYAAG